MSKYGDFIKDRLRNDLTGEGKHGRIERFTKETKIPRRTVANWISPKSKTAIPIDKLPAIAQWFNESPDDLLRAGKITQDEHESVSSEKAENGTKALAVTTRGNVGGESGAERHDAEVRHSRQNFPEGLHHPSSEPSLVDLMTEIQSLREESRDLKTQILKRLPEPRRPELWPLFRRAVAALSTLEESQLGEAFSEIKSLVVDLLDGPDRNEGDEGDEGIDDIEPDEPPLHRPKKTPRAR